MAAGVLLVVLGLWLLLQTIAGDLPGRIASYRGLAADDDEDQG